MEAGEILKVTPLAADSMGVRSMAVFVDAEEGILIDPSAALGPRRFGLPPTRTEERALEEAKSRIAEWAKRATTIIITHYHRDHYDLEADFYHGRRVIAKDGTSNINWSQRKRAFAFKKKVPHVEYTNGGIYDMGGVEVSISPPFPHGPAGTRLGYVHMVTVDDGNTRFLFSSDVQGPVEEEIANYIIQCDPDIIYLDGPPTYLLGTHFTEESYIKVKRNLTRILRELDAAVVIDHHLLRDENYRRFYREVGGEGRIKTAAELAGLKPSLLEARRRELHRIELSDQDLP